MKKNAVFVVAFSPFFSIANLGILHRESEVCFTESAFEHTLHQLVLSRTLPFRKIEKIINSHVDVGCPSVYVMLYWLMNKARREIRI